MREGASPRSQRGWCGLLEALFSNSVEVCSSIGVFVFLLVALSPLPRNGPGPSLLYSKGEPGTYICCYIAFYEWGWRVRALQPATVVVWSMEWPCPCRAEVTRRSYLILCVVGLQYSLRQDMAGDVPVIVR